MEVEVSAAKEEKGADLKPPPQSITSPEKVRAFGIGTLEGFGDNRHTTLDLQIDWSG